MVSVEVWWRHWFIQHTFDKVLTLNSWAWSSRLYSISLLQIEIESNSISDQIRFKFCLVVMQLDAFPGLFFLFLKAKSLQMSHWFCRLDRFESINKLL